MQTEEYIPVRVKTLRVDDTLLFDVFILVGEKRIHYIRQGDPFEAKQRDHLAGKKVKKLWILEESENLYLDYLDDGIKKLTADASGGPCTEEQAALVNDALTTTAENVVRSVQTPDGLARTGKQIDEIAGFLSETEGALKGVLESAGVSDDQYQHASTVSSLSLSLADRLGLKDPKKLQSLGQAALLHDIGKTRLGDLAEKPSKDLTEEERQKMDTHPALGATFLKELGHVSIEIIDLVASHELVGDQLSALPLEAQVLSLCNAFDRSAREASVQHTEHIFEFFDQHGEDYPPDYMAPLGDLLKGK